MDEPRSTDPTPPERRTIGAGSAATAVTAAPERPGSDLDLAAQARRDSLRERLFGVASAPVRVDRFVVLETLGAGGMGVVYAAYDPRLNRRIALKLVKPETAASVANVEARLLREAQAMARLSHPNVVQVHEVGDWEGRVFIAMELVAGRSLATWLARPGRGWREVVDVFVGAGRGLAAAHSVGIVHRDFKPENVLVGDDGRVRVTDFGLARGGGDDGELGGSTREHADPLRARVGAATTAAGTLAGTPAFMSPEQFLGEVATPASDQFSFCVALYQSLHGARPFPGDDRAALARSVLAGELRTQQRVRIPRRIHRALLRGLARAPEARFPAMAALLAEIQPRSSLWRVGPAALVLAGAGAFATMTDADPCADTSALVAGVWDDERRSAAGRAFDAANLPDADILGSTTSRELDDYMAGVTRSYTQSCRAQLRGESSRELHDLRVACLRRRLDVVRGVTLALAVGSPGELRAAPKAAAELEGLGACEDARTLVLGMEPPPIGHMSAIGRLQAEIDGARSLELLGALDASRGQVERALLQARALGHPPTVAEALYQRGRLAVLVRDFTAAEPALRESLELAIASRHDALVGEVCVWLIQATVLGNGEARGAEAQLRQCESWLERTSAPPLQRAEFQRTRSVALHTLGDFAAAEAASRSALELRERAQGPEHFAVAIDRHNHANLLDELEHTDEAIEDYHRVFAVMRASVGDEHSIIADVRYNLGVALMNIGGPDELVQAQEHILGAQAIVAALRGPHAVELADGHLALARIAQLREDLDEAERQVALALEVLERHPAAPDRALALLFRGALAYEGGRLEDALRAHEEARAIALAAWGESSHVVGILDGHLGDIRLDRGDPVGAAQWYESALAVIEGALGADAPELIGPLLGLGRARFAGRRGCDAVDHFDRALALLEAHDAESDELPGATNERREAAERCTGMDPWSDNT